MAFKTSYTLLGVQPTTAVSTTIVTPSGLTHDPEEGSPVWLGLGAEVVVGPVVEDALDVGLVVAVGEVVGVGSVAELVV